MFQILAEQNRALLFKFRSHINVEVCSSFYAVKYLHKYIYKGGDRAEVEFAEYEPGEFQPADGQVVETEPQPDPQIVDEIRHSGSELFHKSNNIFKQFTSPNH
eukprot:EG_transcript_20000